MFYERNFKQILVEGVVENEFVISMLFIWLLCDIGSYNFIPGSYGTTWSTRRERRFWSQGDPAFSFFIN